MSNELSTSNQFSLTLQTKLEQCKDALPADFNTARFVQNSLALLNGNDSLIKFSQQHGTAQVIAGLMRGAYLGLDALNAECYLIPYGSTLQFMSSYRGMIKLAEKYSQRKIKSIYAKVVREGDEYEEGIEYGEPYVKFVPKRFNDGEVEGAFAVCLFEDGGKMIESMSKKAIETCRRQSKAKNSPAWSQFWEEMAKKTVLRRLCKSISIDMDAEARSAFESGTEVETDTAEIAKKEIAENENSTPFEVDEEVIFDGE